MNHWIIMYPIFSVSMPIRSLPFDHWLIYTKSDVDESNRQFFHQVNHPPLFLTLRTRISNKRVASSPTVSDRCFHNFWAVPSRMLIHIFIWSNYETTKEEKMLYDIHIYLMKKSPKNNWTKIPLWAIDKRSVESGLPDW